MTGGRYRLSAQARADIEALAGYIAKDSVAVAKRFILATKTTCGRLADVPQSGARRTFNRSALANMRMMRIDGFDACLIFYVPSDKSVDIIRVVHSTRDLPTLFS